MENFKITYSWSNGLFFVKVYRHFYPDGQSEIVAFIPKWHVDRERLALNCIQGLRWGELIK